MKLKITLRGHFCPDVSWDRDYWSFSSDPAAAKAERLEKVLGDLAQITEVKWTVVRRDDVVEGSKFEQYVVEPGLRGGANRTIYWEMIE